jgi:oligopeptide transport system substrate-binding protein
MIRARLLIIVILLGLACAAQPFSAIAQAKIAASNSQAAIQFPDRIVFSADLQSGAEINSIVLEYGVEQLTCGTVEAKAFPQFAASQSVKATWTWEMKQSGSQPPGAKIWWRWHVTDAAGNTLLTDRQTIIWLDHDHAWRTISGEGLTLHWYNGGEAFGAELHDSAVKSLADLAQSTGLKPDGPIDLYIYANAQAVKDSILYQPGWTGGAAYASHNIVIIGISPESLDWGKRGVAHELTHVLAGHLAFSCLGFVPIWLEEGLAVYGEGGLSGDELRQFKAAVADDSLASVRALSAEFSEDRSKADLSYSQSYSLVNFLIDKYGHDKILALLRTLRGGQTVDEALQATYGFNTEGLEDAWRAEIGARPRPVAVAVLTPTSLPTPVPTLVPISSVPSVPTGLAAASRPASSVPPKTTPTPLAEYRPRPTATAYAPPTPGPDTFVSAEYGVSLHYPSNWSIEPGDDAGPLVKFVGPEKNVFSALFVTPLASDQTLPTVAPAFHQASLEGLDNVVIISDGAVRLDDGHAAWTTLASGVQTSSEVELKINLTSAITGQYIFTLLTVGQPASYDANLDGITALIGTLHFDSSSSVYGIPRSQALVISGGESTNPRTYDPATTHGSGDKMVFSGLVSFDPHLNLVPDLAEVWQVSSDGTTYTFALRNNARFHNSRPVTAQDVVYSWERAANPKADSDTVLTYLGDIVGVKEMAEGKADHISGLKVLDDHTLQVTIDAPKPYFLLKLTLPVAFVVDRANVESGPEWYRTPNGTGPYRLARWDRFKLMLYERNSDYYLEPPAIPYVVAPLYSGVDIRLYETGDIDMGGISVYDVPRVLDPKDALHADLRTGVSMCTSYVVFDNNQPPFDDPKVRQAFTMAFDRQKYIDVVMQHAALPAEGLYPPGLPGFTADLRGLPYDPERARRLLGESRYGGPGGGLPPIVYTSSGNGGDVGSAVAAMAQMWQQTLGVTVTVENLEPNEYLDEITAGHHGQIFGGGWCADYPDPENFADTLFHTGAQQNRGNYSNRQLDGLLEQARIEQNTARRIQLYQQAEQLIVDDAPVLFLSHGLIFELVKPYVQGYEVTPISVPLERYLRIDPTKIK